MAAAATTNGALVISAGGCRAAAPRRWPETINRPDDPSRCTIIACTGNIVSSHPFLQRLVGATSVQRANGTCLCPNRAPTPVSGAAFEALAGGSSIMLRVVTCVAIFVAGCAFDPRPAPRSSIVQFKSRTCTVTTRPMSNQEFCGMGEKTCSQIATCGEAYYRYTTCREIGRDGGTIGERNGIPCQNVCGNTPLAMAAKIRSEPPFLPPLKTLNTCV